MKKYGRYTLEELQNHFKGKRISETFIPKVDFGKIDDEKSEIYGAINKTLQSSWNPISKQMGYDAGSGNYSVDNPLIAMRDGLGNALSEKGIEMLDNADNNIDFWNMIGQLASVIDNEETAQNLLDDTTTMAMEVMRYPEMAKVVKQNPIYEDFNHKKFNNLPARDYDKKFNHTRAKVKMVSLEKLQTVENDSGGTATNETIDKHYNLAEQYETESSKYDFWNSLSEKDKQLLTLKMQGKSQAEIADEMGYKTHSAVGKRLKLLKKQLLENMH